MKKFETQFKKLFALEKRVTQAVHKNADKLCANLNATLELEGMRADIIVSKNHIGQATLELDSQLYEHEFGTSEMSERPFIREKTEQIRANLIQNIKNIMHNKHKNK